MTLTQEDAPAAERLPTWAERLCAPFAAEVISYRPAPWCKDCGDAADKVCARHHKKKCERCGQTMTDAHNDLEYVGHADVTMRLNEVDPRWTWEPAYREVDPDLLAKAIASGSPQIVEMVIRNSPPKLDRSGGMWAYLVVHDDDGEEVRILCYGDAGTKSGPNAMKERIGDMIRNGAMRRGVATGLWSKSERAQAAGETAAGRTLTSARRDSSQAEPGTQDTAAAEAPASPAVATALARLARTIALKAESTVADLEAQVYQQARRRNLLTTEVPDPFHEERPATLSDVIRHAKSVIERRPAAA